MSAALALSLDAARTATSAAPHTPHAPTLFFMISVNEFETAFSWARSCL